MRRENHSMEIQYLDNLAHSITFKLESGAKTAQIDFDKGDLDFIRRIVSELMIWDYDNRSRKDEKLDG